MKERMKTALLVALACGALAGCTKTGPSGSSIIFTAASAPEGTRTEYSGEGERNSSNALVKERINWSDGDRISVYCPEAKVVYTADEHVADYVVVSHTTTSDNLRSRAVINPVVHTTTGMPNGLWWGSGEHHFYARYPADQAKIDATSMSAEIPATQPLLYDSSIADGKPDMQYAFMLAKATSQAWASEVELDFYPEFTAFQFVIGGGGNVEVKLTSFTLTSETDKMSGPFTVSCSDGTVTVGSTATPSVGVSFENYPNGRLTLSGENTATVTVFALPKDMTKLTLTITGTNIGTRTLKLQDKNGNWLPFTGKKKYIIKGLNLPELLKVNGEDIDWDIEVSGEDLIWD